MCIRSDSLEPYGAEGRANSLEEHQLGPEIGILERDWGHRAGGDMEISLKMIGWDMCYA